MVAVCQELGNHQRNNCHRQHHLQCGSVKSQETIIEPIVIINICQPGYNWPAHHPQSQNAFGHNFISKHRQSQHNFRGLSHVPYIVLCGCRSQYKMIICPMYAFSQRIFCKDNKNMPYLGFGLTFTCMYVGLSIKRPHNKTLPLAPTSRSGQHPPSLQSQSSVTSQLFPYHLQSTSSKITKS